MDKTAFAAWSESEDGKKILAPYVDRKVSEGIATFKSNHPLSADLTERLDRLETALGERDGEIQRLKLEAIAREECRKAGIDYDLLDGFALTDERAVLHKIERLAEIIATQKTEAIRRTVGDNAFRPGGAAAGEHRTDLRKLSEVEAQILESFGELDPLLERQGGAR